MTPSCLRRETAVRDRWMVSYMDVLTILLIFFVAVAAQVRLHPDQKPTAAPPPAAVPTIAGAPSDPHQTLLQLRQKLEPYGLEMRIEPRGLVISLPQAILFTSGEDRVSPQGLPVIAHIAEVLRDVPNEVTLIGHADAVPIHNRHFLNNWDLAAARSLRMLELLSHRYGIQESRLSITSFGTYRPAGPNDTPEGRAHNRRVEIVISQ